MDAKAKQELVEWIEKNKIDRIILKYPHLNPLSSAQAKIAIAFICRLRANALMQQVRKYEREAKAEIEKAGRR
jgi:hypothetical protein